MTDDNIDTNIDNWNLNDIFELFDLVNPTIQDIMSASKRLIEGSPSPELSEFIIKARDKATKSVVDADINKNKSVRVLDAGQHFQMNRETKGLSQTFNTNVAQGTINPNHVTTTERMVIIDSQYRSSIIPYSASNTSSPSFNTNFSVDLSDHLTNVLSLELYSIHIPQTWYNISAAQGNNGFTYVTSSGDIYYCTIPDGFYNIPVDWSSPSSKIVDVGEATEIQVIFTYDTTTMRIVITTNTSSEGDKIIWHSDTQINTYWQSNVSTSTGYCGNITYVNNNLGWSLGIRTINDETGDLETLIDSDSVSISADAACSLYGPQYLILSLDDYQHNRLNNSIVGTVDTAKKLDMPSYNDMQTMTKDLDGNCVAVLTAPRHLTQAQLYTINAIYQNRLQKKNRISAPTTNNVLAIIPVQSRQTVANSDQSKSLSVPAPINILGRTLMSSPREYFGPVNIERLGIKLLDDKGALVDLNGSDWSFIIKVKQLYQY
jgi:hypothetical protein